jgi:hypothetical protein
VTPDAPGVLSVAVKVMSDGLESSITSSTSARPIKGVTENKTARRSVRKPIVSDFANP